MRWLDYRVKQLEGVAEVEAGVEAEADLEVKAEVKRVDFGA
jgi:hypothetical protein